MRGFFVLIRDSNDTSLALDTFDDRDMLLEHNPKSSKSSLDRFGVRLAAVTISLRRRYAACGETAARVTVAFGYASIGCKK